MEKTDNNWLVTEAATTGLFHFQVPLWTVLGDNVTSLKCGYCGALI